MLSSMDTINRGENFRDTICMGGGEVSLFYYENWEKGRGDSRKPLNLWYFFYFSPPTWILIIKSVTRKVNVFKYNSNPHSGLRKICSVKIVCSPCCKLMFLGCFADRQLHTHTKTHRYIRKHTSHIA